jgi:spore germination protein
MRNHRVSTNLNLIGRKDDKMQEGQVSNRQLAFIVFIFVAAFPSVTISKDLGEIVGTGTWIVVLSFGVMMIAPFTMYTYLGYVHKNKNFVEYSGILVGKFITYVFSAFIISSFSIALFIVTRDAGELIKTNLIVNTPAPYISLLIFLAVYYLVANKITNIGRFLELFGLIFILLIVLSSALMSTKGEWINLKPIWGSEGRGAYLKGWLAMILPFGGNEVVSSITLGHKNTKKVFMYIIIACISITLFYIFVIESNFSVIGVDEIVNYRYPGITAARRVELPFMQFFRRLDGLVLTAWIIGAFCTMTISAYVVIIFITRLFPKANYYMVTPVVLISCYILGYLPKVDIDAVKLGGSLYTYSTVVSGFLVPIVLVIVSKVKGYKASGN